MPGSKQILATLALIIESLLIGWLCLSSMLKTYHDHAIILGIAATLACYFITVFCHYLYQPLKPYLQKKAPITISLTIMITLAMLILQTPTDNIYLTAIGILFYTRLIQGLVRGHEHKEVCNRKYLGGLIAATMGATIAAEAPNQTLASFLPWMSIFLVATTATLWQSIKSFILMPIRQKCSHWRQAQIKLAAAKDSRSLAQKLLHHTRIGMLGAFMLLQVIIGECYWLKTLIQQQHPSLILVFLIANIGFLCALYLFSQAKLSTTSLMFWGLSGSAVTAPLQFMIGDSSSWIIALAGQGFYLFFAASSFMGCWQRLSELLETKITTKSLILGTSITLSIFLGLLSTSIKHIQLFNQPSFETSIMISMLITGFAIFLLLGHFMTSAYETID